MASTPGARPTAGKIDQRQIWDTIAAGLLWASCLVLLLSVPAAPTERVALLPKALAPQELRGETRPLALQVLALAKGAEARCLVQQEAPVIARECPAVALSGAIITVFRESAGQYFLAASAATDSSGRVVIADVALGPAWVLVHAPGYTRRALQLELSRGLDEETVFLALESALTVRVLDEQGVGLVGATVLVEASDALPFGALTDKHGVARVDRLPPAPFRVTVALRGYEVVTHSEISGDLRVTLRKMGGFTVHVVDASGEPVAEAEVLVVGTSLWPMRTVETDGRGTAVLSGLLAGSYDLKARSGSLVSATLLGSQLAAGERAELTLRLEPGRLVPVLVVDGPHDDDTPVADADVVLAEQGISPFPLQGRTAADGRLTLGPISPGPALIAVDAEGFVGRSAIAVPEIIVGPLVVHMRRGATIRGVVVDRNDHAIDGARIEVIGTDLDGLPIAETPFSIAARRGHFAAALSAPQPLIQSGELGVMPGPIPAIPNGALGFGASIPSLNIELPPISNAWVSDVGGDFKLHPVSPGRVRLLVRHPGYVETVSSAITVAAAGEATVRVVMLEGASLEGRVVDDAGLPVANLRVEITATRGVSRYSTLTLPDGTFEFAAVPAEIELSLARPDNPTEMVLRKSFKLKDEERRDVELILPAERPSLRVTVVADRQAIDLAQVLAYSLDPEVPLKKTLFTDPYGVVEIPDAAGLPLRLQVEAPGWVRHDQSFDSAPATIQVELRAGVLVQGSVTAVRGRVSVSGAQVLLLFSGQRYLSQSDSFGSFEFRDIPVGPAELTVSHPDFASEERQVTIEATGRTDRAFELEAVNLEEGGTVTGVVVTGAGDPVVGARVAVGIVPAYLPVGELPAGIALSSTGGEFELKNVHPGRVAIEAYAIAEGRGRAEGVEVRAAETTSGIRLVLEGQRSENESGAAAGVAVTLGELDNGSRVEIVHVAAGSEAERAGIEPGDELVRVNGAKPRSMADARARLSGPEGSDVLVEVSRPGARIKIRLRRQALRR